MIIMAAFNINTFSGTSMYYEESGFTSEPINTLYYIPISNIVSSWPSMLTCLEPINTLYYIPISNIVSSWLSMLTCLETLEPYLSHRHHNLPDLYLSCPPGDFFHTTRPMATTHNLRGSPECSRQFDPCWSSRWTPSIPYPSCRPAWLHLTVILNLTLYIMQQFYTYPPHTHSTYYHRNVTLIYMTYYFPSIQSSHIHMCVICDALFLLKGSSRADLRITRGPIAALGSLVRRCLISTVLTELDQDPVWPCRLTDKSKLYIFQLADHL